MAVIVSMIPSAFSDEAASYMLMLASMPALLSKITGYSSIATITNIKLIDRAEKINDCKYLPIEARRGTLAMLRKASTGTINNTGLLKNLSVRWG